MAGGTKAAAGKKAAQPKGTPVSDSPGLEREADVMGARALAAGPADVGAHGAGLEAHGEGLASHGRGLEEHGKHLPHEAWHVVQQ